jgi:predicted DNA-binding mobile mystery protein A
MRTSRAYAFFYLRTSHLLLFINMWYPDGRSDTIMSPDQTILARNALDRRRSALNLPDFAMPSGGWLKAVREALGLTVRQFASRLGTVPSRVATIEQAEVTGSTSIKTLREAAEALDCVFIYAIVPRTSLDEIVRAQAEKRADAELARLHHTMRLENQALVSRDLKDARERLIRDLLAGSPRRLWDEPEGQP